MSYIGTSKVGSMYLGSTKIAKAYLGDTLVYGAEPPDPTLIAYWNGADAAVSKNWVDRIGNKRWNLFYGYAKGSNYFELDRISNVYRYATLTDNDFGVDYEIKFVVDFELKPDGTNNMIIMDMGGLGVTPAGHWGMYPRYKADNTWAFSVKYNGNNSQTTTSSGTFPVLEAGVWTPCSIEFGIEHDESTDKQRAYMKVGEGLITSDWLDKKKIVDFIASGNKATLASSCYQPSGTNYSRTRIRFKTIKVYNVANQSSGGGDTPSTLPYDAEIEYLQTSGTQYINTGIIQQSRNFEVSIRFQWVGSTASQFESFFAYMAAGSSITPRSGFHKYVGSWMFGTNTTTSASARVDGNVHDILWTSNASTQKEQLFLDGTKIGEGTTASTGLSTNAISFFLGCRNRNGSTDNPASMRIMSLNYKYFSDAAHTTLVQEWDFIPVRVGSVGYLYEKNSGTLLGNAGTGSFTLGNDKS